MAMRLYDTSETDPEYRNEQLDGYSYPDLALGCMNSDDLLRMEYSIRETIRGVRYCNKLLCIALGRIKVLRLYGQIGISSFSEYLRANRIDLNYHTAHDYARIGEVYIKYHVLLRRIGFSEEDGLRKLLHLEEAISKTDGNHADILQKLKNSSYRQFKKYLKNIGESGRPDCETGGEKALPGYQVEINDECIVLNPLGIELVWFDTEIKERFGSDEAVQRFKHCILSAVKEFMVDGCPIKPGGKI